MTFILRIAALGLVVGGISASGQVFIFMDGPSAVLVGTIGLVGILPWFSPGEVWAAWRAGLGSSALDARARRQYVAVLRTHRWLFLTAGVVGNLVGFLCMLVFMDSPKHIGPAMAVALLSGLYAALIAELIIAPMINGLVNREVVDGGDANLAEARPT